MCKYAIIWVPEKNWVPFAMAIAKYLFKNKNIKSYFVTPNESQLQCPPEDFIKSIIPLCELEFLSENDISCVFLHSFGWREQVKSILNKFKNCEVYWYADGFKNEIALENIGQNDFIINFGFSIRKTKQEVIILSYEEILEYVKSLSNYVLGSKIPRLKIDIDTLVCLRYYGAGAYAGISLDEYESAIVYLIREAGKINPVKSVAVKADPRFRKRFQDLLKKLRDSSPELKFFDFDEVIDDVDWVDRPVEWILPHHILDGIESFIVFDSSLSYILGKHSSLRANKVVVLGFPLSVKSEVELRAISGSEDDFRERSKLQDVAVSTIRGYTQFYANALIEDDFLVRKICDCVFLASNKSISGDHLNG